MYLGQTSTSERSSNLQSLLNKFVRGVTGYQCRGSSASPTQLALAHSETHTGVAQITLRYFIAQRVAD